jgi:hypothetical protein
VVSDVEEQGKAIGLVYGARFDDYVLEKASGLVVSGILSQGGDRRVCMCMCLLGGNPRYRC